MAFSAARAICRRHARSFYFSSFLLPRVKRNAAYAVYAFCRLLDDAVDQAGNDVKVAEARIARFERALGDAYSDTRADTAPTSDDEATAALRAFAITVRQFTIPKSYFLDLAHGCRMDLTISRYDTWAELERYCYHVAGVVGLIMSSVFGPIEDEETRRRAVMMGNALQLTNILRDVGEDLQTRRRIYLPREDLERFGVGESQLRDGRIDKRFIELMRFEIVRARALYREGATGLKQLADDGSRLTACAMSIIYAGILGAIERNGYDVFRRRAHLTTMQKIGKLPRAWSLRRASGGFERWFGADGD
jgi:phytoene synthase